MASVTTYDTLVQNLKDVTEDDGAEFAAYLPTVVSLAETRLIRELDFPELETTQNGSLIALDYALPKVSEVEYVTFFYVTLTDGKRKLLKRRTDDYLIDYWPDPTLTGEPEYYSEEGTLNQFLIAPTPDISYSYTLRYMKAPTKLSPTVQTNYFISNLPDALFNACMVEAVKFLKAFSQVTIWEQAYQNSRQSWNAKAARQRRDDGNTPMNLEGGQNTITHTLQSGSTS